MRRNKHFNIQVYDACIHIFMMQYFLEIVNGKCKIFCEKRKFCICGCNFGETLLP